MAVLRKIKEMADEMTAWRQHLHAHPELSGHESETADFLEKKLASFGYSDITRLGNHGVVATLKGNSDTSGRAVIFRADTDALPIHEATQLPYASENPGVMHACGHDGHMAMLLGAAKYLKENPDFDGMVHFLFQPAEETGTGARDMIAAGLFEKFPASAIYGLHNVPTFPLGLMGTREGEMLSAAEAFKITISGKGGHASDPKKSTDVLAAAAELTLALKKDFERHIARGDKAVLTVSALHTESTASNVLSGHVTLLGTIRSFDRASARGLKKFLEKTAASVAKKSGATASVDYSGQFPVLSNTPDETAEAVRTARDVLGWLRVLKNAPRTLGTEDFAFLLQKSPGNYMAMGTGPLITAVDKSKVAGLHSAKYDFNDAALPIGATYWAKLAQRVLPKNKGPKL